MARAVSNKTKLINTAVAGTLGFLIFFPILWIVVLSLKTEQDAIRAPLEILFNSGWTTESFSTVQARSDYFKHFSNSVIISVGSTLLGLLIAIPAAWSMAFVPAKRTKAVLLWMLSPKMLPPLNELDGSTASTATRCPCSSSCIPKRSKKVLLPTPGTPVTPMRWAPPACGSKSRNNSCACC